ncbi:uncharacterized protein si:dkeyp-121d4.3 isoform X2 [Triplophysa rosa]|uniref:Cold shock domain-containing protein n=1 Tax=Triplophysa rosa TaxID=992332 RepID=A0A9W7WN29_TRIRA|nr:uncharacterized protein si:dkeyp-121d4.3 isoform X2 [Triplophysa rosa]KAI7805203.1 hypothetical protein IRJ41_001748 [Triplophysa rosa]
MGKNKRGKGRGQPRQGMRPPGPHPAEALWPRPSPPGGFRGPAPFRPMGPPGQRFPMPPNDFGPQQRMMMNNMGGGDRRFMDDEPLHEMNFQDRPGFFPFENRGDPRFPHHPGFDDRPPPQRFHPPECGPRYHPPDFADRPPDFYSRPPNSYPSEFNDRPGFPMMNPEYEPMDCYRPRDPNYIPPMDVHGNPAFRESGGFAGPPQDFQGPGPVPPQPQTFKAPGMPPPRKPCPPQPQKKKEPAKPVENKTEPSKTVASKITTFKNIIATPPRGRSLGVITFVGNSCGFIERDDLRKYSFAFNAFYGIQAHLVPGVKVHFTVVKTMGKEVATDVKVAPGGTEDIESTLYEGVVIATLTDDNTKEPYPGRVRAIISVDPIKLAFGKTDTSVTLLMYDRVEFHLMSNVLTKEQRATNIKPKLPDTFELTKEIREKGVIVEKANGTLTIKSEKHDNLTASAADRLSEDELIVNDKVEFTVMSGNDTKKAIRLKKLSEGTLNQDKANEDISEKNTAVASPAKDRWKPVTSEAGCQELVVSSEKHEGTILKTASKNSQTPEKETAKQEPALGLLVTTVEGTDKKLSFRSADVITKATMMVGDKVQFNISTNSATKEESAVNLVILPESFQTDSEERRKNGHVIKLDDNSGFIKTQQDPKIFFNMSEVMEETKLTFFEKVEYSIAPNEGAAGGSQAIRIRRLNEGIFTSASKLEAVGVKEKKNLTIKLLQDSVDKIKEEVKTEGSDSNTAVKPNTGTNKKPPSTISTGELKKECEIKQEKVKKDDRSQSRDKDASHRRRSRSRSRESNCRRRSRSGSRSRDRFGRVHRSSSRERRDSRYRCSRSRERSERRRRSRSREKSSRSARKRSYSPDYRDDRSKKYSSSKDANASNRKRDKSPEEDVDGEISKKRKELMELNEMIARKKAIVAMEHNAKRFEVEGEGQHGVQTFDYQHCENLWMPEVKPVKSILKKQSELHSDLPLQVSASEETSPFVQSAGIPFPSPDSQRTSAFKSNTPVYSTLEDEPQKSLTASRSKKIPLLHVHDPELERKKKQLDELSESIARKRAIIALEQKSRGVQDVTAMKREFEMNPDSEQFVLPKKNFWSAEIKPNIQPKKSILKKRTELLSFQSDTTSVDNYDQVKPSQDDSLFTKPSFQSTAASPFVKSSNPQPVRSDTLGLFNKIINESQPSLFNKPAIVPKSLAQASNLRSLHDQNPLCMSKATGSQEGQHRVISSRPHSESPSTSQTSPSDQKRTVTTQMERFLSALNKADSSLVSSLIQDARRDLPVVSKPKPPQQHLDRNIPFMDEIYDPFQEDDDDNDEPSPEVRDAGRHSIQKLGKSLMEAEDPNQDDLLPHERAIQDGSGFSQLVGTKYGVQATAKAERKLPYGHQMAPDNWSAHQAEPDWSEQWKAYTEDKNRYSPKQEVYADEPDLYRESSQSAEYQSISPNIQHSYVKEMPDSTFDKSVARQQSEESNEDKKEDQFEKIQSLLQTIGFHLDTGEVSKLADRTRERLYGKAVKPHSMPSFDRNRESSVSQSERGGSSRADSSDAEGFRLVSPAQSSNRKVYMSYKDSVKNKDQLKVEDVDLTSIKRTILNVKSGDDTSDPVTPSAELTTVSPASYQPAAEAEAEAAGSQYAQNTNVPAFLASQYSHYSNEHNPWSCAYSQYASYGTYGAMPPPSFPSFHMPPNMMPGYSSYDPQSVNPYLVAHPHLPVPFAPSNNIVISPVETKKGQPSVRCLKTIQTVNMTAATDVEPAADVTADTHPASEHPMQTRSKLGVRFVYEVGKAQQVATITEEQKKRLEQFNQRMKLKKEKQLEAQRSRGQKQNSTPGKSTPSEKKNVWICGHSLVFWAEKRANSLEFGGQLGMHPNSARIWWKGMQGLTRQQLLPLLLELRDSWPKPDVLIVHLGGNDISTTPPDLFISYVKKDLSSLKNIFPGCLLVWSDILSRQFWRDVEDSRERDIIRMGINDSIHNVMTKLGGTFVTHDNISPSSGLYRPDGVHLSGKGIDTFNLNLQEFLEKSEIEKEKSLRVPLHEKKAFVS